MRITQHNKRYLPILPEFATLKAQVLFKLWQADKPVAVTDLANSTKRLHVLSALNELTSNGWTIEEWYFGIDELYVQLLKPRLLSVYRGIVMSWIKQYQRERRV